MKKYHGNYLGLVVDDQDPEYRNRVKVFVPAISTTLFKNINNTKKDFTFAGVGANLADALDDDTYQELKKILPWAECAAPLFGGSTAVHYNPVSKIATNKNNTASTPASATQAATPSLNTSTIISGGSKRAIAPMAPSQTAADASGQTTAGAIRDSFSGSPNMLRFVASIAARESTGYSTREAYSDYDNTAALNSQVRNPKIGAKGKDYGYYKTNGENNEEAAKAGIGSLNGFDLNLQPIETSALEQTQNFIAFITNVLDKQRGTAGVVNDIERGDFTAASKKLKGRWPSLPGGLSYGEEARKLGFDRTDAVQASIDARAKKALDGDPKLLAAALNPSRFIPGKSIPAGVDPSTQVVNNTKITADKYNENTYDLTGTYSTAMPGGMFSTPRVNSHVWVFFNEGDLQYPVYFAQHTIAAEWQRIKQAGSPASHINYSDDGTKVILSSIAQPGAGNIQHITQQTIEPETGVLQDNSGIKISTAGGGTVSYMSTGHSEYVPVNKTVKVAGDEFRTVEGHRQRATKGSETIIINEDQTIVIGDTSEESIQAAKQIKQILETGHRRTLTESKVESPKRIKCPICYGKVISDKGSWASKILKRAADALLNVMGKDSIASRAVRPMLTVAIEPLKETTVKKMRKGETTCGSPNCVNNTIPDYNARSQEIEQMAVEYQESVFNAITDHEQKLGTGGNQMTIVAKNSHTRVGLIMNDLDSVAKIENSFPIKNGMELVSRNGIVPVGDAISTFKILDVPGPPIGRYELVAGTKYSLKVGSRGIHMQTTGTIELDGSHFELTSNYISLGNESGITKINGGAVMIEAKKSITLGGSPTNVHVNGSLHASANITTVGSVFANGNLYAKRLIVPCTIQKTDLASNADTTTGFAAWGTKARLASLKNTALKKLRHYNPLLHGGFPATANGMRDIALDWITKAQTTMPYDNTGIPTGICMTAVGPGTVFNFPHIHLMHGVSHSHSFKAPEGQYVNDADEMYGLASMVGASVPDIT